jgi:hypothetical protein
MKRLGRWSMVDAFPPIRARPDAYIRPMTGRERSPPSATDQRRLRRGGGSTTTSTSTTRPVCPRAPGAATSSNRIRTSFARTRFCRCTTGLSARADRGLVPGMHGLSNVAEVDEPWEGLFDGIIEAAKPYPRHSQKPEIFADHISRLWPNTPKLEMYYRAFPDPAAERERRIKREAAGWYFYGDEVAEAAE